MNILIKNYFNGGVHPDEHKELSEHKPFELINEPEEIVVSLSQNLGKEPIPAVKKNDLVKKGLSNQ
ncbi:MAG: hypothetical protein N3F03_00205 [Ignavibacteria bacterium]|nr:hypothetical protein [Ignavibacteria bacterium]